MAQERRSGQIVPECYSVSIRSDRGKISNPAWRSSAMIPVGQLRHVAPGVVLDACDNKYDHSSSSRSEGILHSRNATLDLTGEERAEVLRTIRAAIDGERFVLSPRIKRLKEHPGKAGCGALGEGDALPGVASLGGAELSLRQAEGRPASATRIAL